MNKTIALLLVASLLLAGCTELTDAVDEAGEEILKIDVDEDIALEKVEDFLTVDESESFGITVMYEIDMSEMGDDSGMLEVDEGSMMLIEMTEAWSPDGYHSSSVMGMGDGDVTISMMTSMTHVGTTMYVSIGYEIEGELGADATEEETAEFDMMVATLPEVEHFSMVTTTTHTEVIAAMAEESNDNSDDMDPMVFLEMIEMIEEYGTFTPADSVDGLQMFDVAIDPAAMMESETPTAEDILDMCDADDNQGLSWNEFTSSDCADEDDTEFETLFNDADTDMSGELTADELPAFIEAVMALEEEIPTPEEALDMCDGDASNGISWDEFIAEDCDDTYSEDMAELEAMFNQADADGSGEITMDELQGFIDSVSTFYETDMDDDMEMGEMPAMQVAFTSTGDIEYFSMEMDEMGDEPTVMMMYILTEERVDALFTGLEAGETVALPFSLSFDMYDDDWDDDWSDDGDFYCNDGTTIPMDWVNDGMDDCAGGEDEFDDSEDLGNLYDGCTESTDPADSYYECWMNDWLDSDGNIMMSDGYEMDECTELADGSGWDCLRQDSFIDDMIDEWLASMDADGDGNITWDEHDAFINSEEGWESDEERNDSMMIWSDLDADSNGGLDADELVELFALLMEYEDDGPTFICGNGEEIPFEYVNDGGADCADGADEQQYDSDGNETNWFDCMDGSQVWISQVNDGTGDCPDGEDEMPDMGVDDNDDADMVCYNMSTNMVDPELTTQEDCEAAGLMWTEDQSDDYGGEDYSDETVMYVTSDMDFHFEGDLSDYKIELATCEEDYDMDTGEETMTCTTVMSVAIADAGMDSDIMFHDADSSGTLSVGDMIHIGETAEEWDTVRLYSVSADAYSDENPMHDAPGFTGLVGMLALLGAAFIRRNE
ncbi:MAG: hypothetical protein ACO3NJ_01930 [Candidatus Poseidoniaceae archaeon]